MVAHVPPFECKKAHGSQFYYSIRLYAAILVLNCFAYYANCITSFSTSSISSAMLFYLLVKNFAKNNVLVDYIVLIALIYDIGFYLNINICTVQNSCDKDIISGFLPLLPGL